MKSRAPGTGHRAPARPGARGPKPGALPDCTFTFFGGKGGVGKTTCAAATAILRAETGRRVLVISTDPAHSLGDALGVRAGPRATPVKVARQTLHALELDADRVLDRWLRAHRTLLVAIGERGTFLDRADVEQFMDLSFPGVSELLALSEIVRLVSAGRYEEAVIDTAPTGHTLRLLATPEALGRLAAVLDDLQAKHRVLVEAVSRRYRDDAADRFIGELADEARSLGALLRDPERTRFVWVTVPEPLAVAETRDGLLALAANGMTVETIIINRVTVEAGACGACAARRRLEAASVGTIGADLLRGKAVRRIPAFAREPIGVPALRRVGQILARVEPRGAERRAGRAETVRGAGPLVAQGSSPARPRRRRLSPPLEKLLAAPPRLLFTMGKGGVGKTTCAAALAVAIARRPRCRVLLLSVDPAHSIGDVLAQEVGNETVRVASVPRLHARELDAQAEFERARVAYRVAVDDLFDRLRGDSRFDAAHDRQVARNLIELAPPGLDELFALITMIALVTPGPGARGPGPDARHYDHIVVDTAPTGHALRLFEMRRQAHEWVRALMSVLLKYGPVLHPGALAAELVALSKGLRELDALFADRRGSAIVAVTRAAALPRLETRRLVAGLRKLGMARPALVVVNAVTRAEPGRKLVCAQCRARAEAERVEIDRLRGALRGCAIILAPAQSPPPRGGAALARFLARWIEFRE